MQRKNLLQFILASAIFIVGLFLLRNHFFPPRPLPPKDEEEKVSAPEAKRRALGLFGSYGSLLAVDKHRAREKAKANRVPLKDQVIAAADSGLRAAVAATVKPKKRPALRTLGSEDPDSDYHLLAEFDPLGGSVRRIVLNKFKAASKEGRPEKKVLELVPPDPFLNSNVLYHYDVEHSKSDHPLDTLGKREWKVERFAPDGEVQSIRFVAEIQGVRITKTFTLAPHEYHLGLEVKLELVDKKHKVKFRYQLTGVHKLPIEGRWYTSTFRHSLIGLVQKGDLWRNYQDLREISSKEGGESVTRDEGKSIQYAGVAVQFFASVIVVDNAEDNQLVLASARPTLEARVVSVDLEEELPPGSDTLVVRDKKNKARTDKYFLSPEVRFFLSQLKKGARFGLLCVPRADGRVEAVQLLKEADTQPLFLDDITVRVNTEPTELGDQPVIHKYLLYNGPIKAKLLGQMKGKATVPQELVDRYVDTLHLNTLTDYQSPGPMGSFASKIYWTNLIIFFTNLMHSVLWAIHNVIPNYGICIILLTVLVRGMMFPISRKQALTSMKMQELAPELKKLQEKHKDDPRAKTEAMMALYRKHGVNPLGSCWMLLLQMPIFMGLYYALQESVHFRLAGFLWIENLAAPDMLFSWGDKIPWISRPEDYGSLLYLGPYFNVLPILAVTLMIFQQKLLMPPPTDEQQVMQQKMMKYMMIFFGLLFYKVAAGLCIYFIASSLWGFAERKLLPKKKPVSDGVTADGLLQKALGTAPRESASEPVATTNGEGAASNRGRRRLERKRRLERAGSTRDDRVEPSRRQPADGDGEGTGWWARMRRKVGNWWREVLKKAEKK